MQVSSLRIVQMHRLLFLTLALCALPVMLAAQTSPSLSRAAATLTARDVAQRIGIIAADSMLGRDTPSRGLDLTAQYVAEQFRAFGLKPGGDEGSWFQRYPIERRRLDLEHSRVIFSAGARSDTAWFYGTRWRCTHRRPLPIGRSFSRCSGSCFLPSPKHWSF
jgi:hypothetical protein